jgi:anaerobic carbon-monoxide dehydrogenase iron sulfur subunit
MPDKVLAIDQQRCTGCRRCEMVCSVFHHGASNPARSRVHVLKLDEAGFYLPMSCQNCEKPLCTEVCPAKACHRDLKTNKVIIDGTKCIGCKTCILACPFGAPSFDSTERVTIKCDFCNGDPQCVAVCETKAIDYVDTEQISVNRRREVFLKFFETAGSLTPHTRQN